MQSIATETSVVGDREVNRQLTGADRCDSCGAQAYIRVEMASGELLFCAHHGREVKAKLAPIAKHWHDESDRLLEDHRS
ncbi:MULTISPECIES: DUF7455 domain-containing protein [Subtercola]|uniref:DUF7455 domain-containing protein n=1 Tax=Subtercola vilae TaxID=2056433 RepID=A0A4T2CBI4_9MICO|nr:MULTISPECIES: hypothetical protein [Subtercola]MEA9984818.1 hypothetical protein [Subtercola sp. RTI3]TIH39848.1 hypothetical protein D4765_03510 [Subtercola vilae]